MDTARLTVGQVMSRTLVAVDLDESPLLAWEIMRRAGVHHLPVVDGQGRLRGILTREDLTARWSGGPMEQSHVRVRALLTDRRRPHTTPGTSLAVAVAAMIDAGVDAIGVIGDDHRLAGMMTATDVLRAVAGRLPEPREAPELMTGMFRLVPVVPSHVPA
ncbi:HPP family protein [Streptosporangium longisporum]|uniref:CBS domain-containing protein n=1 Tax=Streptosporangium longisporum TaxID=46187 RepID=A0ABP6KA08_9ACTN